MSKPIRMCIVCRNRFLQDELNRLQCKDGVVSKYTGYGRSFYICINCIDNKILPKKVSNICKNNNNTSILKEILIDAKSKN